MFVDTHAHLDFDAYDEDRELVIQHAIESKVSAVITIGVDVPSSRKAIELSEKYAPVFAAVGIHPTDSAPVKDDDFNVIRDLASHEKVVAIGEIGLDYYHMRASVEQQKAVFRRQIEIARKLKLPIIVHNRDSHDDIHDILTSDETGNVGGVLHSFTGDKNFMEKILLTDFYISFTGSITFKKNNAAPLVVETPLERLLLETDSPFLAPVPLRGKRNEPSFIVHTAKKIAELKKITIEKLAEATTENAIDLFKLSI